MLITLAVLGISVLFFVKGDIRADLVALTGLIVLMVSGVLEPEEALSGFSHPVLVMMVGLFIVGGGVLQTGLAHMLSRRMIRVAGDSPFRIYLLVMVATSFIGAFVSNTGTVALMLPIVVSLAISTGLNASRLLMPMAFASSMGGMMTLIGTPPNLLISTELVQAGYPELSFFVFARVGGIIVVVGIVVLWFLSKKFLNKGVASTNDHSTGKSLSDLAREYHLNENIYRTKVRTSSSLSGQRIGDLDVAKLHRVIILVIERKVGRKAPFTRSVRQMLASPDTVIRPGDLLYLSGEREDVILFLDLHGLRLMDKKSQDDRGRASEGLPFDEIGIAEIVVLSNSKLVNRLVRDSGFRENYSINVLGIQRNNRYLLRNLKDERIHAGDALLVHGRWTSISRLHDQLSGTVVLGQPNTHAEKVTLDHKAPLAALIMTGMVASMVFQLLPAVTAVMLAAIVMVFTGCLRNVEAAFQTINWESVLLIGAMLPMSLALEKTGVSQLVSQTLVAGLGDIGPIYLLAGIYLATSVLTMFINNTATAVLFAPIAMQAARVMDVSPYPFLFAVAIAASMCFASPFSTPPNALVMSAGRYTFMDYVKVGLPLQMLLMVLMVLLLPLIFPF